VQKTKAELAAASELTDRRWAALQASREVCVCVCVYVHM
jgi:hypothetical protein